MVHDGFCAASNDAHDDLLQYLGFLAPKDLRKSLAAKLRTYRSLRSERRSSCVCLSLLQRTKSRRRLSATTIIFLDTDDLTSYFSQTRALLAQLSSLLMTPHVALAGNRDDQAASCRLYYVQVLAILAPHVAGTKNLAFEISMHPRLPMDTVGLGVHGPIETASVCTLCTNASR